MDCSPPGSSVHGILQARVLEWAPCSPPGDLPAPGIKPESLRSPALASRFFTASATWEAPLPIFGCPLMCQLWTWMTYTVGGMGFHFCCISPASPTHPSLNGAAEWLEPWPVEWEIRKGGLTNRLSLPPCRRRHWLPYQEPYPHLQWNHHLLSYDTSREWKKGAWHHLDFCAPSHFCPVYPQACSWVVLRGSAKSAASHLWRCFPQTLQTPASTSMMCSVGSHLLSIFQPERFPSIPQHRLPRWR